MTSSSPLKVLIVDDERVARARLREMLTKIGGVVIAGEAADGLEAMQEIESLSPDVVLLDVQMPQMTGIEVAAQVKAPRSPRFIFVTAYDRYAIEAFEVAAIDYLLKPVKLARLVRALDRARSAGTAESPQAQVEPLRRLGGLPFRHVVVRYRRGLRVFAEADVISVEVQDKFAYVNTGEGQFLSNFTLTELEERLDPQVFCRVHRQYLVNLNRIVELQPLLNGAWQLIMAGGQEVPVSRNYAPLLKQRLHC